jgi:PEGA domain
MRPVLFAFFGVGILLVMPALSGAQQSHIMGELRFSSPTKAVRDSGVWVDGQYVGYLKELKGANKISLLPGDHEIIVRQAGYKDYTKDIVAEPRQMQTLAVTMQKDLRATYPTGSNAAKLKLNIAPARAAVFVDEGYIGHASDFGGYHIMVLSAGKHRVKVELPGYRTFETEVDPLPGQTTEIKTGLLRGGIEQAGALIRE